MVCQEMSCQEASGAAGPAVRRYGQNAADPSRSDKAHQRLGMPLKPVRLCPCRERVDAIRDWRDQQMLTIPARVNGSRLSDRETQASRAQTRQQRR